MLNTHCDCWAKRVLLAIALESLLSGGGPCRGLDAACRGM